MQVMRKHYRIPLWMILIGAAASTGGWGREHGARPDNTTTAPASESVQRFYADDSFWNTPIPDDPNVDPNSARILETAILPFRSNANFTNGPKWGISVVFAPPGTPVREVKCTRYGCGHRVEFAIPDDAQPDTGSDHHLVVIAGDQELDLWDAHYDPKRHEWSAGSRYVNDLNGWGACGRPGSRCNNGVAAGFNEMGGVVRPEEIRQGHIDHALSITTPYTRARFIACPATHTDGKYDDPNAIPEGALIQMDPSFNVDAQPWPMWEKIIAKALQKYGAYVSDTGGSVAIYGQSDMNSGNTSWSSVGVPENGGSLSNLPWDRFRVLTLKACN